MNKPFKCHLCGRPTNKRQTRSRDHLRHGDALDRLTPRGPSFYDLYASTGESVSTWIPGRLMRGDVSRPHPDEIAREA